MSIPVRNFTVMEFACPCHRCRDEIPNINPLLLQVFQAVRNYWNLPITITSGYRCPPHNASVGGSAQSRHCDGEGGDGLYPSQISPRILGNVALIVLSQYVPEGGGLILYKTHFHIDIRPFEPYYSNLTESPP